MAKESMRKKLGKIYLIAFVVSVVFLLVSALFVGYWKNDIMYDKGRTLVYSLEGVEYEYRKFDDSGAVIVSVHADSAMTEYSVPEQIDGRNVIAIGKGAFADHASLESIRIHDSVKVIESNAFAGGSNITIYCEAPSQPSSWADNWLGENTVVWGINLDK